jgi:hypothetical protein
MRLDIYEHLEPRKTKTMALPIELRLEYTSGQQSARRKNQRRRVGGVTWLPFLLPNPVLTLDADSAPIPLHPDSLFRCMCGTTVDKYKYFQVKNTVSLSAY